MEKGDLAKQLGAHHYIDSLTGDVANELQSLGGARVIAATATNAEAISAAIGGLGLHGELLLLALLADPVQVSPIQLINISGTVRGHPVGDPNDLEDTLNFAALQGIKPMVEVLPLEKAADGYQRMPPDPARFRWCSPQRETGAVSSSSLRVLVRCRSGGDPHGEGDVDLANPDTFVNGVPHDALTELRRTDPVHWQPIAGEPGFWAVLRHADVAQVNRHPEIFSASKAGLRPRGSLTRTASNDA